MLATSEISMNQFDRPRLVTTQPLLQARGLVKHYGNVHAVDGVDVEVYPGEVLGIVGESGSGKSTVLRLLNLEEPSQHGEYFLNIPDYDGKYLFTLWSFPEARGPYQAYRYRLPVPSPWAKDEEY